jgi:Flp pilus assembly protein TadD
MNISTDEHNKLYKRAIALVGFTSNLVPPVRLSLIAKWKVRRGLKLLQRVVELKPDNWAALWVMGKAYQATNDGVNALGAFERSFAINPQHADIAREASISAMECARFDVAMHFAESAVKLRLDDPGLRANLALALLLSQNPQAAKVQVDEALTMDQNDHTTIAIQKVIDQVLSGARSCPSSTQELFARAG